jgi:hypothetical protein
MNTFGVSASTGLASSLSSNVIILFVKTVCRCFRDLHKVKDTAINLESAKYSVNFNYCCTVCCAHDSVP